MAQGGAGIAKRLGTLLSGLLECGGFCGIIFGWASLVFVLKDLGYFQELCQPSTNLTELPGTVPVPSPAVHLAPPSPCLMSPACLFPRGAGGRRCPMSLWC